MNLNMGRFTLNAKSQKADTRDIKLKIKHVSGHISRGARVFFQGGGEISKKGTPTKVVYSNHVAIKLAHSLIFLFSSENHSVL